MTTHPSCTHLKSKLEDILAEALGRNIASSLSVAVVCPPSQTITLHRGLVGLKNPTNDATLYDLASLTKILGTTMAVAKAVVDGVITLDETPWDAWPHISIGDVLRHTAGLPAHKKFFKDLPLSDDDFLANKKAVVQELTKLATHKNSPRLYADVGFMAVGFLLEERYQKPLMAIFADAWQTCGIGPTLRYFPSVPPHEEQVLSQVAPTFCYERSIRRQGQVHDANCHYVGGLAGHAGLFGTLSAVIAYGEFFLSCANNPVNSTMKTLADWAKHGIGFDKPTPDGSNACLSKEAFGHFGYTGVSLFMDPALGDEGVAITLLTNRINESDRPEGIFWLRKAVNEAVVDTLATLHD